MTNFSGTTLDASRHIAHYNGSPSIHTFSNCEDTVLLNNGANLGICFIRFATDMGLDVSSNYTISCWAKTTKPNSHLDIGLSYYNTSDAGVWRGGSGAQNFNAVNTWQHFTRTFKPDADTKAICYCFTMVGESGGTDTFTIKHCKLEKGSVATVWTPSPNDPCFASAHQGFIEEGAMARIFEGHLEANEFIEW